MASDNEERRVTAWIGHGVEIEGRISSSQDLRIDGKVEGTIAVGDHSVIIGQSATITADLTAKSVLISGNVTGDVTASVRVELKAGASLNGDIAAPRLVVEDGATVNGTVDAGTSRHRAVPEEVVR